VHAIGLSAAAPGAYAEQLVVEESLMLAVPNGLSPDLAALTEPMAIAWHAVRRAEIKKGGVAIVIGCKPVGLAVICMLKAQGVRTIVASDFSAGRRGLAMACGADVVVDPSSESPYARSEERGHLTTVPAKVKLGLETMDKLSRVPVPWHYLWPRRKRSAPNRSIPSSLSVSGCPAFSTT
jgi:threonine dehydrogenase-like Zn-dependent dehydrogenase